VAGETNKTKALTVKINKTKAGATNLNSKAGATNLNRTKVSTNKTKALTRTRAKASATKTSRDGATKIKVSTNNPNNNKDGVSKVLTNNLNRTGARIKEWTPCKDGAIQAIPVRHGAGPTAHNNGIILIIFNYLRLTLLEVVANVMVRAVWPEEGSSSHVGTVTEREASVPSAMELEPTSWETSPAKDATDQVRRDSTRNMDMDTMDMDTMDMDTMVMEITETTTRTTLVVAVQTVTGDF
jgi:hypothetical protein